MQNQKSIIDNIRKKRFGLGLDKRSMSSEMQEYVNDSERFKDDAAMLIFEIFSIKPRFILELIQNAEDDKYEQEIQPSISFIIYNDKLILKNNEKGFNEANVDAICKIGGTTKLKKLGYIGEKGIGFKSVFMVSNEPCIYSNGFQFKFTYDSNKPTSIIIPIWIDSVPNYVDLNKTNIILPLKIEAGKIVEYFDEFDATLLLFLRKLELINIENKINNKTTIIKKEILQNNIKIIQNDHIQNWSVIKNSTPLKVPDYIDEEKRADIKETDLILAFPLKFDGYSDTSKKQKLYAFLPIRDYGFKFIIQADFLMPPSREDLYKDRPWNLWLRNEISSCFLQAVDVFKKDSKLKLSYYNYIPLKEEIIDEFFLPLVDKIHKDLKNVNSILTNSNNWAKPTDVLYYDKKTRGLITNNELKSLLKMEFTNPKLIISGPIRKVFGIQKFGLEHLFQCIQNTSWLERKTDKWFIKLYEYLNESELKDKDLERFKQLKIIRLANNKLVSTSETQIFFPLDNIENYGFESELNIIKKELLIGNKTIPNNIVKDLFKKMGVKNPTPVEIIEEHIIPIYESENEKSNWQSKSTEILLGNICYIKDNLEKYEEKRYGLSRLKKSLYLRIKENIYDHPEKLYLTRAYGNENNLEQLFEMDSDLFLTEQYIKESLDKFSSIKKKTKEHLKEKEIEIKKWKDFFIKIGVNEFPRCDFYEGPIKFDDNYPTIKEKENYTKYQTIIDWRFSPEFKDLLNINDIKRVNSLIKFLNENWTKNYTNYQEMTYRWFHRTDKFKKLQSTFIRELIEYVLKYLRTLINTKCSDKSVFINIYDLLSKIKKIDEIKDIFQKERLIYVPNNDCLYFCALDVFWEDQSKYFKRFSGYLENHYPTLKNFFISILGVKIMPTPKNFADLLEKLSNNNEINDDIEKLILEIYKKLNNALNPQNTEYLISDEDWWEDFSMKPIFLTNKKQFWKNENNLFVNDNDKFYELFKNKDKIAFLNLPKNVYPKIQYFIKSVNIPYVSKSIDIKFIGKKGEKNENNLTENIHRFIFYILRYLYKKDYETYLKFKDKDFLNRWQSLRCISVEELKVEIMLFNEKEVYSKEVIISDNIMYIQRNALEERGILAAELSSYFGGFGDFNEFLSLLFELETEERIEKHLKGREIFELPSEELELLKPIEEISGDNSAEPATTLKTESPIATSKIFSESVQANPTTALTSERPTENSEISNEGIPVKAPTTLTTKLQTGTPKTSGEGFQIKPTLTGLTVYSSKTETIKEKEAAPVEPGRKTFSSFPERKPIKQIVKKNKKGKTKNVIEKTRKIKDFSSEYKDAYDNAISELKNIYSGYSYKANIPCQICSYYCDNCHMKGDVIDGFSCTATCNLIHFNDKQQISSRAYDLWTIDEFENLETKVEIDLSEFFRGYTLILCHNHGIAFNNFKIQLREAIYGKSNYEINENSDENLISFKINSFLFDKSNNQIPIGFIFSKQHLDFFFYTYEIMKTKV